MVGVVVLNPPPCSENEWYVLWSLLSGEGVSLGYHGNYWLFNLALNCVCMCMSVRVSR